MPVVNETAIQLTINNFNYYAAQLDVVNLEDEFSFLTRNEQNLIELKIDFEKIKEKRLAAHLVAAAQNITAAEAALTVVQLPLSADGLAEAKEVSMKQAYDSSIYKLLSAAESVKCERHMELFKVSINALAEIKYNDDEAKAFSAFNMTADKVNQMVIDAYTSEALHMLKKIDVLTRIGRVTICKEFIDELRKIIDKSQKPLEHYGITESDLMALPAIAHANGWQQKKFKQYAMPAEAVIDLNYPQVAKPLHRIALLKAHHNANIEPKEQKYFGLNLG